MARRRSKVVGIKREGRRGGRSRSETASKVWQFEIHVRSEAEKIVAEFGDRICLVDPDVKTWPRLPKYCILIELKDPKSISPFTIDKKGFGSAAAWITVDSIESIQL